ncbi:LysR family transcriptional regulator (plasmid) [Streptomyces sp. CG4]|uniref:LysR family transcriptional regulator n=1 Tax=Streptomyces sp. CG4 TaxID=408783 RepID=UPI0034E1E259
MSIRRLAYFLAVIDHGSFTRAAAELFVSQSALSHQMQALEREVGTPLLNRLPHGVEPTTAGEVFATHARKAVASIERGHATARAAGRQRPADIRLGMLPWLGTPLLRPCAQRWLAEHPDAPLTIRHFPNPQRLYSALNAGEIDVAVGPPPQSQSGDHAWIGHEDILLITPADSPLSHGTPLAHLHKRSWIHYPDGSSMAALLDEACHQAGFAPRVAVTVPEANAAPPLVAAGLGIALVPGPLARKAPHVHAVKLHPPLRQPLVVTTPAHPSALAQTLAAQLRNTAAQTDEHEE